MAASLFSTATEYMANALTLTRGQASDIHSVGIYASINPNTVPAPSQFTTVLLVDGTQYPVPPLGIQGEIDVLTKVGPGSAGPPVVPAGDLSTLTPGSYQIWILVVTSSEQIIRKVDTPTVT